MAVTSRPLHPAPEEEIVDQGWTFAENWTDRAVAIAFWLCGWYFTDQVARLVLPEGASWIGSFVFQLGLTKLEAPIWNKERRYQYDANGEVLLCEAPQWWWFGPLVEQPDLKPISPLAWAALVLDDLLNMAGIWLIVKVLHELPPALAIAEMFQITAIPAITGWTAFWLCAILGAFFCGAPEKLWSRR